MTTSAIIMMCAALVLLWGGLAASIIHLARVAPRDTQDDPNGHDQVSGLDLALPEVGRAEAGRLGSAPPEVSGKGPAE